MSTLNVSNITDGTTTVGTSYVVNGSAKAWAMFNFGTVIQDSVNVSSLTDNATGKSSLNFSNNLDNNLYAASSSPRNPTSGASAYWACVMDDHPANPRTASKITLAFTYGDQNEEHYYDSPVCATAIHGDLA